MVTILAARLGCFFCCSSAFYSCSEDVVEGGEKNQGPDKEGQVGQAAGEQQCEIKLDSKPRALFCLYLHTCCADIHVWFEGSAESRKKGLTEIYTGTVNTLYFLNNYSSL